MPAKPQASLADIFAAIKRCYRASLGSPEIWHYVTVAIDGDPYIRQETTPANFPADEFDQIKPVHPATVFLKKGDPSIQPAEIDHAVEAFDPVENLPAGLQSLTSTLEEAGFQVVD